MASELLVSRLAGTTWAALREDGTTVELRVETENERGSVGRVVKARVTRVLPGIQSAFLDVGADRDAFLHAGDLLPSDSGLAESGGDGGLDTLLQVAEDDADDADTPAAPPRRIGGDRSPPIEERLREGGEILVQVAREGIGTKGSRVTALITLPGRYLVFLPQVAFRGVSRRISDPAERSRLRQIVDGLPPGGGYIVRTAGDGASEACFRADAAKLNDEWEEILRRAACERAPSVLRRELGLTLRLLRDARADGMDRVIVDDEEDHRAALAYLSERDPVLASRIHLHAGPVPLFEAFGLKQDVERALRPRVWLRSGGSIVVEQTEALVTIDVNTGKYVGTGTPEETVLRTNLEAAAEIARQLRLRDLGGIIVVDFIDMEDAANRRKVLTALEEALRRDRARTKVLGLSELGLVQLTRKRTRPGLAASLTRPCPACGGHGRIKLPETVAREAIEEVRRLAALPGANAFRIRVHPDVAPAVRIALFAAGAALFPADPSAVEVVEDPGMRPDLFDVLAE